MTIFRVRRTDAGEPAASEITPRAWFEDRRRLLQTMAGASVAGGVGAWGAASLGVAQAAEAAAQKAVTPPGKLAALPGAVPDASFRSDLEPTGYEDVTTYNNYYEFGTGKGDPSRRAGSLKPEPWKVVVDGEVGRPTTFDLDDLRRLAPLEERIYRLRCVEAWSMVIPWVGYPLAALLRAVEPTGQAKFVEFTTLADGKQMPGLRSGVIPFPYVEGLRLDEAMHPLTLLAMGLYGEVLPNQNGAPVRLVVPWKYGFKSAKSLVRIRLTREQPETTWHKVLPAEYGFYANVNPEVDHPRWSQGSERPIGGGFFTPRQKTLMFNGYADQVASLYSGMDLKRNF